jgi:hypothetical protein
MPKKTVRAKLTNYDPAEDLGSDEAIAVFMAEAFQTNDVAYISHALGVVARAKGMAQIAGRRAIAGAALPVVQCEGESDAEDDAGGDEGAGRAVDDEGRRGGVRSM